jgi:hypothetical protein
MSPERSSGIDNSKLVVCWQLNVSDPAEVGLGRQRRAAGHAGADAGRPAGSSRITPGGSISTHSKIRNKVARVRAHNLGFRSESEIDLRLTAATGMHSAL